MNRSLENILRSQTLQKSFTEIFFANRRKTMTRFMKAKYLSKYKRPSAEAIDKHVSALPARNTITQTIAPLRTLVQKEYNTKKGSQDVPSFLEYLRDKLRAEFCDSTRFGRSDNFDLLHRAQAGYFETNKLDYFRAKLLGSIQKTAIDDHVSPEDKENYAQRLETFSSYISNCGHIALKDFRDKYNSFKNSFMKRLTPDTPDGKIDITQFEDILTRMFIEKEITSQSYTATNGSNLPYSRIRREINLGFDHDLFQSLVHVENLLESYRLGLINDSQEIVFNGDCFVDRKTGQRVTDTEQRITPENITQIGKNFQSAFILPENMVYGMVDAKNFGNALSYTTQHEHILNGDNFTSQNPPLYFNKDGFFGPKKKCYSVKSTGVTPNGKNVEYTHTLYTPINSDNGEVYVKVSQTIPSEKHVKITLYAFPLNHVGAGIQICRVENNPAESQRHTLKGGEAISTNFHVHLYNLIDQVYVLAGRQGHYDISYKLSDKLDAHRAEVLFNYLTKIPNACLKESYESQQKPPIKPFTEQKRHISSSVNLEHPAKHYYYPQMNLLPQKLTLKKAPTFKDAKKPIPAADFLQNWHQYSVNGLIKQKTTVCALTSKTAQPQIVQTQPIHSFKNTFGKDFVNQAYDQSVTATTPHTQEVSKKETLPKLPVELPIILSDLPITLPVESKDSTENNNAGFDESSIIEVSTIESQLAKVKTPEESLSTNIPPEQ